MFKDYSKYRMHPKRMIERILVRMTSAEPGAFLEGIHNAEDSAPVFKLMEIFQLYEVRLE